MFAAMQTPAALFEHACSQCHLLNRVLSKTKTKNRWKKTVDRCLKKLKARNFKNPDRFIAFGEDEAKQITTYLFSKRGYRSSKTANPAEDRRKKHLEKFTPSKASTSTVEEKRKYLRKKFTPSKTIADRQKKLQEKLKSSKSTISTKIPPNKSSNS
jgi:hypothetical protein